jgi:hypothetical protein
MVSVAESPMAFAAATQALNGGGGRPELVRTIESMRDVPPSVSVLTSFLPTPRV